MVNWSCSILLVTEFQRPAGPSEDKCLKNYEHLQIDKVNCCVRYQTQSSNTSNVHLIVLITYFYMIPDFLKVHSQMMSSLDHFTLHFIIFDLILGRLCVVILLLHVLSISLCVSYVICIIEWFMCIYIIIYICLSNVVYHVTINQASVLCT